MAENLEAHDFRASHGNRKYPWESWQDGKVWKITRGEDFDVEPRTMQGQIKVRGKTIGRGTETNVVGESVVFSFQGPSETPESFELRKQTPTPASLASGSILQS